MGIKKGKKGINTDIELPTTIDFYNQVMTMTTKVEVSQACYELTDKFHARKYAEATISKKRGGYRREFISRTNEDVKKFSTEKPDLFKELFVPAEKKPDTIQHCAIDMLSLTDEEKTVLDNEREISKQESMGIKNGVVMDISNVTKIDITKIIDESFKCLTDDDPLTIACGILNLTGLRPSEQCMPSHEHKEAGIVEHTMVAVSEYEIAFRGVVKKRDADGTLAWYKRITLVPAQKIVDAREKYLQSKKVQALTTNTEKFSQSGFYQALNDKYTELFGESLSTLKVINEDGTLKGKDGTPHKGRSFYACALRSIVKQNVVVTDRSVALIIQKSIAHDGEVPTLGYLGKYDDSLLINPPGYIEVSSDIEEYGKMSVDPVIPVKENMKSFDILNFMDGIDNMFGDSLKISGFLNAGMSETQAVLAYIKLKTNTATTVKNVESREKTVDNGEIKQTENVHEKLKDKVKEKSVPEKVNEIIVGIMKYNHRCAVDDFKKVVIPSHGYINTISKLIHNKTVAYVTAKQCLDDMKDTLDNELKALGIVDGVLDDKHNGKYHKKTQDELSAKILEYI